MREECPIPVSSTRAIISSTKQRLDRTAMLVCPEFLLTVIKYPDRVQPRGVPHAGAGGMLVV